MTQKDKDLISEFVGALPKGECYNVSYVVARHFDNIEMIPLLCKSKEGITWHFANYDTTTDEILDFTKHRMLNETKDMELLRVQDITPNDMMTIQLGSKNKDENVAEMWQTFVDAEWQNNGYVDLDNVKHKGNYLLFKNFMSKN